MKSKKNIQSLRGVVFIKTNLVLINLAQLISEKVFCGLEFQGLDKQIREEVPAIFIPGHLLGLSIVLSGSPDTGYSLSIRDTLSIKDVNKDRINIDNLLYELLRNGLSKDKRITIVEPTPTA